MYRGTAPNLYFIDYCFIFIHYSSTGWTKAKLSTLLLLRKYSGFWLDLVSAIQINVKCLHVAVPWSTGRMVLCVQLRAHMSYLSSIS